MAQYMSHCAAAACQSTYCHMHSAVCCCIHTHWSPASLAAVSSPLHTRSCHLCHWLPLLLPLPLLWPLLLAAAWTCDKAPDTVTMLWKAWHVVRHSSLQAQLG
jgi:hypothetical protein